MPIPNFAGAGFAAQSEPDSGDFTILESANAGIGVASGLACTPAASGSTLGVAVAAGVAYIGKIQVPVVGATVTPGAASGSNPRIDLVTVDATGTLAIVAGTAAANPVFPAIPANKAVLCTVWIPTSATSITTANISDKRQFVDYGMGDLVAPGSPFLVGQTMRSWRAAWAKRFLVPINILLLGDSNTVGYWATAEANKWAQIFATMMEQACGQRHAFGYQSRHSIVNYTQAWTNNGTVTDVNTSGFGYGAASIAATTGWTQATGVCDRFWVRYTTGTASGAFSVSIDGVVQATIANVAGGITGGLTWDSGPLPRGPHTVRLSATSAVTPIVEGIYWFDGNGNTVGAQGTLTAANSQTGLGVRVINAAKFGSTAGDFAAAAGGGTWWSDGLDRFPPDIVIMAWGTNEIGAAQAPATFRTNLGTVAGRVNTVMATASQPPPAFVLIVPHGTGAAATDVAPYRKAIYQAAGDIGASVIDRNALMGYLDNATADPYGFGSSFDGATGRKHLDDPGERVAGETTATYLLEAVGVASAPMQPDGFSEPKLQPTPDSNPFATGSSLRALRAAWAKRFTAPVNVVLLGDSVTQGYWATTFEGSVTGVFTARMFQQNGQPITLGYIPLSTNSLSSYGNRDWTKANCTDNANYGLGYGASTLASTSPGPAGTASFTGMADRIWVHYPQAAAGLGTFNITLDGVSQGTITPTGTARGGRVWDSGPLTRGLHTITVTANSTTAAVVEGCTFLDGNANTSGSTGTLTTANANTGSGLRIWNAAHFGFTANNYAVSPNGTNWWTDGFDMVWPHAFIIVLGINDVATRTVAQYIADLNFIIARINAQAVTNTQLPPSIIIVAPYGVGATNIMPPYRDAARSVAVSNGAAFIDWSDLMGYVGTAAADTYTLMSPLDGSTAKIHPGDQGHQLLGDNLAEYVTSALGPTGQIVRSPTRVITSAGRSVADGVLAASTTVTSATAAFVAGNYPAGDIGRVITGIGIPRGTTITARASATSITISAAATVSASGVTLALAAPITPITVANDDVVFVNAAAVLQEVLMPSPVGNVGQQLTVKKIDNTSNPVIMYVASPAKIEHGAELELRSDGESMSVVSDGANWQAT